MNAGIEALIAGLCLTAASCVSLAAYSLRDFSRSRLEELCAARGRRDRFGVIMKRHAEALLAVELLAVGLIGASGAAVFRWAAARPAAALDHPVDASAFAVRFLCGLGVLLLSSVVLPWCAARVAGERFLTTFWPLLAVLKTGLKPATAFARKLDTYGHRLSGMDEPGAADVATLTEEIQTVVDEGRREGVIEHEAGRMIRRVIELQEADVSAIMTQRTDMATIPASATLEAARLELLECGHSRIPVIGDTIDDVVGILYAKDLLRHIQAGVAPAPSLADVVREPLYVPETSGIDSLLKTMKRDRVHFAMVIDEYGNVAGLVTMEDILEEIVGEIGDEFDAVEESGIVPVRPGVIEAAAWVRVDALNEQFDFELPEDEDFATIGGFVLSQLGRIPRPGESTVWRRLRVSVLSADKRKIDRVRIESDAAAESPSV